MAVQLLDRRSGILDCGGVTPPVETGLWEWQAGRSDLWLSTPMQLGAGKDAPSRHPAVRNILRRTSRKDRRRLWRRIRSHLEGVTEMFEADLAIRAQDGSIRWLHVCGRAIGQRDDGGPRAFAGTIQSPGTSSSQTEANSWRPLAYAGTTIGASVWEYGVSSDRFTSQDGLGALFGLPSGEPFTGGDLFALVNKQDAIQLAEIIRSVVENPARNAFVADFGVTLRAGRERYIKTLGAVTCRDLKGRAERMCGVSFDISHRRRADQHSQETQDRILKLSRLSAMGFLASTITHEINQPLTALINNLAACDFAMRSEDKAALLPELMQGNKRLVHRIADIIRRTRGFVTSGEVVRVRGSLSHAIRSSISKVMLLPGNSDLRIICALDDNADNVDADMMQIEHVLYNILKNAAEATEGVEDRLIQVATCASGVDVEIHVIDNGSGISDSNLEKLFEPLWTSKETGTGLGLAICQIVVEAHGGKIAAAPGPGGRGLAMHIVMPIRTPESSGYPASDLAIVAGG